MTSPTSMKVASIQMEIGDQGLDANLRRAEELLDSIEGADLILLPELWSVGYFSFESYASASQEITGEIVARMREKARQKSCHLFAGSFLEKSGEGIYNTSVLIDPVGDIIGRYRKIHLYGHNSAEKQILGRGGETIAVRTARGVLGLSTCYDLRFPELYRELAIKGANVFLVAAAWPYPRLEHWLMLNRVRAIENQVFLASSNCVGVNRGKQFLGHSLIVNPWGTILASGGDLQCIVEARIDLAAVDEARRMFPAFTDRVLR